MHEAALVADLVRKIEAVARENGAVHVTSVKIRLGGWSHVSPAPFREHFRAAAHGTVAEGAVVELVVGDEGAGIGGQEIWLESVELVVGAEPG